jgi:hypothetical protein
MTALMDDPQTVAGRLEEIERDLAERQNQYETAARDKARLVRDWDYRFALCMARASGSNEATRKAHALIAAIEQDDLYERLKDAEARFESLRAVIGTLEKRLMIGLGILRSQGRA